MDTTAHFPPSGTVRSERHARNRGTRDTRSQALPALSPRGRRSNLHDRDHHRSAAVGRALATTRRRWISLSRSRYLPWTKSNRGKNRWLRIIFGRVCFRGFLHPALGNLRRTSEWPTNPAISAPPTRHGLRSRAGPKQYLAQPTAQSRNRTGDLRFYLL